MKNKVLSTIFGMAVFFLLITAAIALPIYLRFFYYIHINALNLPEETGVSYQEIKAAYDEVLNYLTMPWAKFGTGIFPYTEEGASHFADCKKLFTLNSSVFIVSAAITVTLIILDKNKKIKILRPAGLSPAFYSAIAALVLPVIIGAFAATDFDRAFMLFHKIFFPGKTNWEFSPVGNPIITVLPQEFFRNCAILIGAGLVIFCLVIIVYQLKKKVVIRARYAKPPHPFPKKVNKK